MRGVNVGGNNKVEMKKLKELFEKLGFTNVLTYLNSGNLIFESATTPNIKTIDEELKNTFGLNIVFLLKTEDQIKQIAQKIPKEWVNDNQQKTDVAYLFDQIDKKETINDLPIDLNFIQVIYTKGALIWNVKRENQNKSKLNKLAGHKIYKLMTVRNVNTARFLANIK